MEYLHPIKILETKLKLYRVALIACAACLLASVIVTPVLSRNGNPVLIQGERGIRITEREPWKTSVTRMQEFLNDYLATRFEWNEANFSEKGEHLKRITTETVFAKMKDSISAFETLSKSQKASSYFILEGFGFSNEKHQIEARISRVLRIGKLALATPLVIQLEYRDVPLKNENPYGLVVSAINESEPK